MGLIDSLQNFTAGASGVIGAGAKAQFKRAMDIVLVDLGREITIHLPPSQSECADPDCSYDSNYKRYVSLNNQICQSCRGQGFFIEPRYTLYQANIRWSEHPYNNRRTIEEADSIGRIGQNFCRTKTVIDSFEDIKDAVGATIDGINVELFDEPRKTAFGDLLYVACVWKVVNNG